METLKSNQPFVMILLEIKRFPTFYENLYIMALGFPT